MSFLNNKNLKRKRMKKLIFILLLTTAIQAQTRKDNYMGFATALDVRNAVVGSPATNDNPELNYQLQFMMVYNNIEVVVTYEGFPRLNYSKATLGFGKHYHLYLYTPHRELRTTFIPSLEYGMIMRYGDWGGGTAYKDSSSHLAIGVNLAFRWNLNSRLSTEYCYNMLLRSDSEATYGSIAAEGKTNVGGVPIIGSNYIKIIYRVDLTKRKL